ncbi:MAG: phosphoadenosine phosphosulfate reductase family protein, partial [Clostridia bacterium]|nr:phosphoadenosine phosphosulfate reductase family protein [Clostridia bacterium]
MPTSDELRILQALPLDMKVARTKQRIREWVDYWGKEHVCVSFSGGKDSTVLLHIVREMYGDEIPAVFVNTGLEFPEIQRHVRSFPNVVTLYPEMNFRDVITKYGYPVVSKEASQCIYESRK